MARDAPWQVRIALDPAEIEAIRVAMHAVVPAELWELKLPIEGEGSPVLSIGVRTEKQEDAEKRASELYAEARREAQLPPGEAQVLGALLPLFAAAHYARLMDEAKTHIEHHRYEWAVVRAQTACEVYGKLALAHILPKGDARSFRGNSLARSEDRKLFSELTGMEVGSQAWWACYRKHLARRHEIVHEGISVTEGEATDSLAAAKAFLTFLRDVWASP